MRAMAQLVRIGKGRNTHYAPTGTGPVPAGRARCELDRYGKFDPYLELSGKSESPASPAGTGSPTCHWCQTRDLPA